MPSCRGVLSIVRIRSWPKPPLDVVFIIYGVPEDKLGQRLRLVNVRAAKLRSPGDQEHRSFLAHSVSICGSIANEKRSCMARSASPKREDCTSYIALDNLDLRHFRARPKL